MSVDNNTSLIASVFTAITVAVKSVGSCSTSFVSNVWQTLGFVFSLAASFSTHCAEYLDNAWLKGFNYVVGIVTSTAKETCLGLIALCLIYLTLSNTFRYVSSKRLSLFPLRLRRQQTRANTNYSHRDRGFESDYEYLNSSDTDDASWVSSNGENNDDDTEDGTNDRSSSNTDDTSDVDYSNDSDEYTVIMEESDSDASTTSQAFSAASSIRDIDIQLPLVDEQYALRSRSSTPSVMHKALNSPEDFFREMERERDKRKCVVCQNIIKSVLILPCRHLCTCVQCADQIVRSRPTARRVCPLCRTRITKVMNIYV